MERESQGWPQRVIDSTAEHLESLVQKLLGEDQRIRKLSIAVVGLTNIAVGALAIEAPHEIPRQTPIVVEAEAIACMPDSCMAPQTVVTLASTIHKVTASTTSTTHPTVESPTTIVTKPTPIPIPTPAPVEAVTAAKKVPVFSASGAQTMSQHARGSMGVDVSYPNPETPIPDDAQFGIVGVNGGAPFKPNPFLSQEAKYFSDLALYVNSNYPGADQASPSEALPFPCPVEAVYCTAYQWGYAAGKYAVESASSQGVTSAEWWIDVERRNPWKGSVYEHRTVLLAMMDAIKNQASSVLGKDPAEITIGFYSMPSMWDAITADKQAPLDQRLWRPGFSGWLARYVAEDEALDYCNVSFTGGPTRMIQTQRQNVKNSGKTIDVNYRC